MGCWAAWGLPGVWWFQQQCVYYVPHRGQRRKREEPFSVKGRGEIMRETGWQDGLVHALAVLVQTGKVEMVVVEQSAR